VRERPDVVESAKELGRAYNNLGGIFTLSGQSESAEKVYHEAIDVLSRLAKDHRDTHEFRFAEGLAHKNLAHLVKETRGLMAAEPERAKARELLAVLAKQHDDIPDYGYEYALSLDENAIYLEAVGRRAQALEAVRTAVELFRRLHKDDPADPNLSHKLAIRYLNLGILLARDRAFDDADANYGHAAGLLETLRIAPDAAPDILRDSATVHENRALLMQDVGRPVESLARWRQTALALATYVAVQPDRADGHANLGRVYATLAGLLDDAPKAIAALQDAVREQRHAVRLAPRRADYAALYGAYAAGLVEALMNTGDHAAASDLATELSRDLPAESPQWPRIAGFVTRCIRLAREDTKLSAEDRAKVARRYGDQALAILKRGIDAGFKDAAVLKDASDLEPLRTGDWKAEFEKLVAQIEAKSPNQ